MGRISNSQLGQLNEIARFAYGSGWINEGKKGGEGYMGVLTDSSGKLRAVKFLTHVGERRSYDESALTDDDRTRIQQASDRLRNTLVKIAIAAGKSEAEINQLLAPEEDALKVGGKPLLSRKIVARAITAITEGVVYKDEQQPFSWDAVKKDRAATIDHTKMEDVLQAKIRLAGLLKTSYLNSELRAESGRYSFIDANSRCQPRLNKLYEELKDECRGLDARYAICRAMNKIAPSISHRSGELYTQLLRGIRRLVEKEEPWTADDFNALKGMLEPQGKLNASWQEGRTEALNAEKVVLRKVVDLVEAMYRGQDTLQAGDTAEIKKFLAANKELLAAESAKPYVAPSVKELPKELRIDIPDDLSQLGAKTSEKYGFKRNDGVHLNEVTLTKELWRHCRGKDFRETCVFAVNLLTAHCPALAAGAKRYGKTVTDEERRGYVEALKEIQDIIADQSSEDAWKIPGVVNNQLGDDKIDRPNRNSTFDKDFEDLFYMIDKAVTLDEMGCVSDVEFPDYLRQNQTVEEAVRAEESSGQA